MHVFVRSATTKVSQIHFQMSQNRGAPPIAMLMSAGFAKSQCVDLGTQEKADPGMKRYSIFSLARNAANYHKDWGPAWRSPEPGPEYDVVIIGAGGHGLATAYYLAKNHNVTNVAVLEKGWLGGGNTGRNTTIIRSNYLQDASMAIYELARTLYEGLSQELNYNVMFSPRGLLMLCQTEHELRAMKRTSHANRLAGIEARMIDRKEVKRLCPIVNDRDDCRYPILGAYYQPRGGTARHDAVAWGYARGADARGVDIIQNCEVTGIRPQGWPDHRRANHQGQSRRKKSPLSWPGTHRW